MIDLIESMIPKNTKNKDDTKNNDQSASFLLAQDMVKHAQSEGVRIEQMLNTLTKKVVELS